jgi:antitoxin Phd
MMINTNNIVSITEANQNFSRVARLADKNGSVIILKNNAPRYLLIEFSQVEQEQTMPDEDIINISRRIMEKNKEAYEVLAK